MDLHNNLTVVPAAQGSGSRSIGRIIAAMVITLLTIGVAGAGFGSTASAGGWAVSTLDTTPTPVSGESVEVGFTIRQHGVTPVNLDSDVGIAITSADGSIERFPATQQGETGHYVATVVFPEAGEYTWAVQQGWFAPQELGALTVAAASSSGAAVGAGSTTDYRFPAVARYGLPALALALAAAALADVIVTRRRRRTVVA